MKNHPYRQLPSEKEKEKPAVILFTTSIMEFLTKIEIVAIVGVLAIFFGAVFFLSKGFAISIIATLAFLLYLYVRSHFSTRN